MFTKSYSSRNCAENRRVVDYNDLNINDISEEVFEIRTANDRNDPLNSTFETPFLKQSASTTGSLHSFGSSLNEICNPTKKSVFERLGQYHSAENEGGEHLSILNQESYTEQIATSCLIHMEQNYTQKPYCHSRKRRNTPPKSERAVKQKRQRSPGKFHKLDDCERDRHSNSSKSGNNSKGNNHRSRADSKRKQSSNDCHKTGRDYHKDRYKSVSYLQKSFSRSRNALSVSDPREKAGNQPRYHSDYGQKPEPGLENRGPENKQLFHFERDISRDFNRDQSSLYSFCRGRKSSLSTTDVDYRLNREYRNDPFKVGRGYPRSRREYSQQTFSVRNTNNNSAHSICHSPELSSYQRHNNNLDLIDSYQFSALQTERQQIDQYYNYERKNYHESDSVNLFEPKTKSRISCISNDADNSSSFGQMYTASNKNTIEQARGIDDRRAAKDQPTYFCNDRIHNTPNLPTYERTSSFARQKSRGNRTETSHSKRKFHNDKLGGKFSPNGLKVSDERINFDKMLTMEADELAVYLSTYSRDLDTFLWKQNQIEKMSIFLKIIDKLLEASSRELVQKALYPFKERKFFDRQDVKGLICSLRCCTDDKLGTEQFQSLRKLLSLMKELVSLVKMEKSELMPSLDSLERTAQDKLDNDQKKEIMETVERIMDIWDHSKETVTEDKLSGLSILPKLSDLETIEFSEIPTDYENEEVYLRRLFLVHRQDFVRPLCKGLISLKNDLRMDPTCLDRKWRNDDIRVYKNIQFMVRCCNEQSGVTWRISFDVTQYSRINWASRKLLQYGSLVCLTNKKFTFLQYATVAERNPNDLKLGILEIKLVEDYELFQRSDILLIESQTFFQSYFYTLESLKCMHFEVFNKEGNLPFGKQLVSACVEKEKPEYFRTDSFKQNGFDFSCFDASIGEIDISDEFNWPHHEDLGMDKSQYRALVSSMNSKMAIIQGPPGTGKTVVGLKIAELLLRNEHIWRKEKSKGPMLLLSYTNHALDQFLLEISKRIPFLLEKDIVRIGRRSEVEELEKFNLARHRKDRYSYRTITFEDSRGISRTKTQRETANELNVMAVAARQKLKERIKEHENLKKMREELMTGIAHQDWLYSVAGVMNEKHYRCLRETDDLINWLYIEKIVGKSSQTYTGEQDDMYDEDDFEFCDSEESSDSYNNDGSDNEEIEEVVKTEKTLSMNLDFERLNMAFSRSSLDSSIKKNSRTKFWQTYNKDEKVYLMKSIQNKIAFNTPLTIEETCRISDIWQLCITERWKLYKYWIIQALHPVEKEIRDCEESYSRAQKRYNEIQHVADIRILSKAKLIACTTTRAARDIENIKRVSPTIIILEEAAEIPEHHVVACLTSSCQQIFMIGDHQQLRPSYNDYQTVREHRINISLFERLIRSRFPFTRLEFQHRMRPEISTLLKPHIYRVLYDDESVLSYRNVSGISNDLFFISHTIHEDGDREEASRSHKNTHEAAFLQELYRYLRLQGYKSSQITVLTPYLDQTRLLRNLIRPVDEEFSIYPTSAEDTDEKNVEKSPQKANMQNHHGVRITSVDNFQGEENDIILLSLVRSNSDNNIGYLSEANRICVALSRAKMGLYVIGNFEMLMTKSALWRKIVDNVQHRNFIGPQLELICQNHKSSTYVTKAEDFNNVRDGGCQIDCKFKRECGHFCSRKCHVDDELHEDVCMKPCPKLCKMGHKCTKTCHHPFRCDRCEVKVEKVLPRCQHSKEVKCHVDPSEERCLQQCNKTIACGHRCQRYCSETCNTNENCNELIKTKARCGHDVQVACHTKYNPPCSLQCEAILDCGHPCPGTCSKCSQGRLHVPCKQRCNRNLVCGHICSEPCNYNCPPCKKKCDRQCSHRDSCKRKCGELCIKCNEPCDWKCIKGCPNGFRCNKICSDTCDRQKCNTPCTRKLRCGHHCPGLHCEEKCVMCKICNKGEITDIFFGTEGDDDAVFIQLDDCRCTFEVTGLDRFIETQLNGNDEDGIKSLKCPRCSTQIRTSSRYQNELKVINRNVDGVFRTLRQNEEGTNLQAKKDIIKTMIEDIEIYLDDSEFKSLVEKAVKSRSSTELDVIADQLTFIKEINQIKKELNDLADDPLLQAWIQSVENWIWLRRTKFSTQSHNEFSLETRRLKLIVDIVEFKRKLESQECNNQAFPETIQQMLKKLKSVIKISEDTISSMRNVVQEVASKMIGLTLEEKKMIKRAMEKEFMGSGHWYKCSNGHYYTIGECGMPMEMRKCPYCNVTIGGIDHRLTDQNERAMDMDIL